MSKPVLVFRADGGTQMGTGHLMRSASLAGILANDFTCKLFTRCTIPQLLQSAKEKFSEVNVIEEGINETELLLNHTDESKLVVLDGYHLDRNYQEDLENNGFRLTVIDDLITKPVSAEMVINHCGGITPLHYNANFHTVFGLGTSFLLLNPAFLLSYSERRNAINDKNCFVCLGGADPDNETLNVVQKLVREGQFEDIHIVIGAAYLHRESIQSFCQNKTHLHLHEVLPAFELKQVMQKCSFAVCSPSTVAHEYLSVGGVVWLKLIAENQKHILNFLIASGLAFSFDNDQVQTDRSFEWLLAQQKKYFDGKANERLEKLFTSWYLSSQLTVRRACEADLLTTYDWVNDAEVRNQSYSSGSIPLKNHSTWFLNKIKQQESFYYILLQTQKPVAQIRFDIADCLATISYLTDPQLRNKGMGPWILSKGIQQLLIDAAPKKIIGHVKKSNIASLRSFEKLAFAKAESAAYPDSFTFTMTVHGNYS